MAVLRLLKLWRKISGGGSSQRKSRPFSAHLTAQYGVQYVVIEMNPKEIGELQEKGAPCIFGDAGNPHILEMAHVRNARLLALTCPDPIAQITASTYAREVNPGIDIVARLPEPALGAKLRQLGVTKIVDPAFEAGLEFVRHTLQRYKVAPTEIEGKVCPALREMQARFLTSEQVEESLIQKE